jgi:cyclopropane fatty-acyl-phospholipid synthase-like methyltransferase
LLNDEVKAIWNINAAFWDGRMGEGNDFHKTLIEPTQLKLLDIKPGKHILDIACGNGQFARKMAGLGAKVTAIDFSAKFIRIARSKSSPDIDYRVVDVTSESDLNTLSGLTFDSIVCTMAMMDMENIEIMINHVHGMLKKDGKFVFSITHPCFNSGESVLVHERDDLGGEIKNRYYVKISNYLVEQSLLGIGMNGQPRPQYYFHRPVSTILKHCFNAGFVLDAFEEPSFANIENSGNIFDNVFQKIPAVLVCRLKQVGL